MLGIPLAFPVPVAAQPYLKALRKVVCWTAIHSCNLQCIMSC
jgi:hypothetical protein